MVASVGIPAITLELLVHDHATDASSSAGADAAALLTMDSDDGRYEVYSSSSAAASPRANARGGDNDGESMSVPVYGLGNVTVDGLSTRHASSPRHSSVDPASIPDRYSPSGGDSAGVSPGGFTPSASPLRPPPLTLPSPATAASDTDPWSRLPRGP